MRLLTALMLFFVIFSTVSFAETKVISVVEKEQAPPADRDIWVILKPLLWILGIIVVILGGLTWLVWYIMKKLKERDDVWWQIIKDKKHLCKIHRDKFRVKGFFKFRNNCPIKLCYTNNSHVHTKTVGYYRGHYLSHDGNMCILFNCRRKWLVFPKPDVLFLNTKEKVRINRTEEKMVGKEKKWVRVERDITFPYNFYKFNPDEIIIYAYALDADYRTGFYYPVLKDKEGNVINMNLPVYESVKQIAIEGYLYDQTDDFVKVSKKSIDLNPLIRGHNKVVDSSSSIETGEQQFRGGNT